MAVAGTNQKNGELRFIITMQWENICNPYGTIAYYDGDDRQTIKAYCNLTDLLFQMDSACDEQGHPQRDTILRSFLTPPLQQSRDNDSSEIQPEKSEQNRLHFLIAICMRQHSSMQGYIKAKNRKVFFRSEMELLKLLSELPEYEK